MAGVESSACRPGRAAAGFGRSGRGDHLPEERARCTGFDDDAVAKVTILAAQLGTALEALRLNQLSREEHRRASILVEVATALHGLPDTAAVMESIADRLRVLLHSPAVLIFVQQEKIIPAAGGIDRGSETGAAPSERVSSRTTSARPLEIATRAVAAGERITVSIDGASHFGEDSPAGSSDRRAVPYLAFARCDSGLSRVSASPFTQEDKMLVSALAGFGAVAIANAELYGMARAQAQELHEILEISFELGSAGKLDEFMQTSVVRAASFPRASSAASSDCWKRPRSTFAGEWRTA